MRQWEAGDKGTVILLTHPDNTEKAKTARMRASASIDEALSVAYRECRTSSPKVTLMPNAAHTWPILRAG